VAFDYRTEYHRYRKYYVNLRQFYQKPVAKVSFFVLLSFVTVIFFSVFAIRPTVTTIGELVREIEDKQTIYEQLQQKRQALANLQGVMQTNRADVELVNAVLPNTANLGRLMQEIEYLSQKQRVQLLAVSFVPTKTKGEKGKTENVTETGFSLTVGGSFVDLSAFMKALEQLDRILIVEKADLQSGATSQRLRGVEAVVNISGQALNVEESDG